MTSWISLGTPSRNSLSTGSTRDTECSLEDREEKLKKRLPYDVDSSDPAMHLTASWVFSGPTMTDLKPQIEQAIEREASEIREAIADGTEAAPVMEIPVQISNTYTATESSSKNLRRRKATRVSHRGDIHERNDDLERLVRLFLRVLGTADRPHRACPSDVAEAMLHIARSTQTFDFISIRDIAYGLSQLPAERLLPDLPPTATKLLKTLLDADEPMGRSKSLRPLGSLEAVTTATSTNWRRGTSSSRPNPRVDGGGKGLRAVVEPPESSRRTVWRTRARYGDHRRRVCS